MNQYYVYGPTVYDVGWFTYLLTNSFTYPLANPLVKGGSFFQTHISLFFYISSFIYSFLVNYIPTTLYYSGFIGIMYGIISSATYLMGLTLLPSKEIYLLAALSFISVLTSMNGVALGLIGFPHIEIAIPALILLFLALYFTNKKLMSFIVLILLLTIREDAGFHLFSLLVVLVFCWYLTNEKRKKIPLDLSLVMLTTFIYSIVAVYFQKIYFPGDNALERVYLGYPHFSHLTTRFFIDKIHVLLAHREYIYVPVFFAIIISYFTKNILLIGSLISTTPWFVLSIVAISNMANSLSNYYAFPFIVFLSWPIFAFAIARKLEILNKVDYRHLLLSIVMITGLSVILFPGNSGNVDGAPWKHFNFEYIPYIHNTEKFISYVSYNKEKFGNILFDEHLSSLFVKDLTKDEHGYLNQFNSSQMKNAETVIFNIPKKQQRCSVVPVMSDIILKNGLKHIYRVRDTNIILATRSKLDIMDNSLTVFDDTALFSYFYTASELPSDIGHVINTSIIAKDTKEKGYITYGPYICLPKGKYEFDIAYESSISSNKNVGNWDLVMHLPEGSKVMKKGFIKGTEELDNHIVQEFVITEENANKQIEIRNFYDGVGVLTIKSLKIKQIE